MLTNHERQKLVEAVLYFATNVKKLGKVKLFKLLYFLDFEHFRDTGRSVTGMDYVAWKMGPVPEVLYSELSALDTAAGEWFTSRGHFSTSHRMKIFDAAPYRGFCGADRTMECAEQTTDLAAWA
ncbi:Panacea domain-containing protein [Burkholderia pseudomallei]|uniref:Panacea domain-containing protein n=1 Tax=Burkholderia pseudomallei TaxID=28450 RepID=UPI001E5A94C7|nr:Panacea domain-containing protein [Burkholderia pseudomallei]